MPTFSLPLPECPVMAEQMFNADLVVTATAVATHPEGAVVPPPVPAEQADPETEQ